MHWNASSLSLKAAKSPVSDTRRWYIVPFVLALIAVLALVTYVPAFTMLPVAWLGP